MNELGNTTNSSVFKDYIFYQVDGRHLDEFLEFLSNEYFDLETVAVYGNYTQPQDSLTDMFYMMEKINIFLTPCIITVGVIFNVLSMLVYTCTQLKHTSSSVYLASLAIVDTVFLISLLCTWLAWIDIHLILIEGLCQLIIYISFVSSFLSVYIVVAFTVERYIAVVFPLKRAEFCTKKRAKICVAVLVLIALILYIYALWASKVVDTNGTQACAHNPHEWTTLKTAMITIDAIVTLVIPSLTIFTLNVIITVKICQISSQRKRLLQIARPSRSNSNVTGVPPSNGSAQSLLARPPTVQNSQLKQTCMLLIVSTVFLVLNLPSHMFKLVHVVNGLTNKSKMNGRTALLWQEIFLLLYYLSFSINFFLYSAYASHFRKGLRELCSKVAQRSNNGHIFSSNINMLESVALLRRQFKTRTSRDELQVNESLTMELSTIKEAHVSVTESDNS